MKLNLLLKSLYGALLVNLLLAGCVSTPVKLISELEIQAQGARWLAFQDGEEAWQVLSLNETSALSVTQQPGQVFRNDGVLALAFSPNVTQTARVNNEAGRYGVARVCVDSSGNADLAIYYNTLEASRAVVANCFEEAAIRYNLTGRILDFQLGDSAEVSAGSNVTVVDENGSFSLELPPDTYDVVTKHTPQTGESRLGLLKNATVFANTTVDIDLDAASALTSETATVTGLQAEESFEGSTVTLISSNGTRLQLGASEEEVYTYDQAIALEVRYELAASALTFNSTTGKGVRRSASQLYGEADLKQLELPEASGDLSFTESQLPEVRWQDGGTGSYNVFLQQSTYRVFVSQTEAYLGEHQFDYKLEDFSTLPGWEDWTFAEGEINWSVYMRKTSGDKNTKGYRLSFIQHFGKY